MSYSYDAYDRGHSGDKTLWIVLGIVGGVVVVCGGAVTLLVVGVIFLGKNAGAQFEAISHEIEAEMAAEEFLRLIGSGRLDAAYRKTSTSFRKQQSPEQFRAMIDAHPKLRGHRSVDTDTENVSGNLTTLSGTVVAADGTEIEVSLDMTKEGDTWKVDRFSAP